MKGVLRWLLGPSFQFNPLGVGPELYGHTGSVVSDHVWTRVSAFGEMIKFLHQAIEWENVLYFLYPYFWSHRSRWEFKKYLDHPDPFHRAFLKAGSARIVLTIRPGFERAFAEFVENGGTGELPNEHPYVRIAEEIEASRARTTPASHRRIPTRPTRASRACSSAPGSNTRRRRRSTSRSTRRRRTRELRGKTSMARLR